MVEQRFTFNEIANDYDAYRPGYPQSLFDDLLAFTPSMGHVLEIGCGTGKATEALARSGRVITALDPGPEMLVQARRRVGPTDAVRFVRETFEGWTPGAVPFDLICAAQAWHWVDPAQGYVKAESLLTAGGVLAIFGNVELPPPEPLFGEIRAAFMEALGRAESDAPGAAYRPGGWIARHFEGSGLFSPVQHRVYPNAVTYDPETYAAMVATYSGVQMLAPERRRILLSNLKTAVQRNGSRLVVQLETHVHWAAKRT